MKLYDVIRKEELGEDTPKAPVEESVPEHRRAFHKRPFGWRKIFVICCAILFLALLYIGGMKLVRAKVIIREREIPFTLEGAEFELVHEGDDSLGRLSFQTMVVPTEVSRQVYGSEVGQSTSYAKGKVVFFNEYSTASRTIKAKTTITSKEGKKYQTTAAVTVPGYTTKNKIKTPGTSSTATVVAVGVGPNYDTPGTSFTVSGYTSKQVYAQSAGAITGGEDAVMHSVSAAEKDGVIANLESQLIERLKRETRAQTPVDLLTFPDLQIADINRDSVVLRGSSIKFPASINGSMTTYLISRDMLESAIANHVLHDHTYGQVTIPSLASLEVTPITPLPTNPNDIPDSIRIRISGEGTIITKATVESIKESLIGKPKNSFGSIVEGVPEVGSAEYHFFPFWAPFFPANDDRIKIEIR